MSVARLDPDPPTPWIRVGKAQVLDQVGLVQEDVVDPGLLEGDAVESSAGPLVWTLIRSSIRMMSASSFFTLRPCSLLRLACAAR